MTGTNDNGERAAPTLTAPTGGYPPVKRGLDVLASAIGLVLISPVLAIAAAAVKLTSPGPIFFTQTRVGLLCRPFRVLKLRTMRGGRTPDADEIVPLDHPEVTAVGRWLRRLKIDELPQIINVLVGDMSIIGPRPTLPDQVDAYDDFERQRQRVRPGCSGLAQINGGAALSWPERIQWDVYYVDHMSPWLDLRILIRTLIVIPLGEERFLRRFDG